MNISDDILLRLGYGQIRWVQFLDVGLVKSIGIDVGLVISIGID